MSLKPTYLDDKKYTHSYFYQSNVCRLCWSSNNTIKPIENDSVIAGKILEYIGIDVTTGTPNKVCENCLNKIKSFANFKMRCHIAEEKLKTILFEAFEENYDNPVILKKEADYELKLLADAVKKDNLDRLIIKEETDSYLEINDAISDYEDLLPKDDDYCYICNLNFDSIEQTSQHNIACHKKKEKVAHKCRGCMEEFPSPALKASHEQRICKVINEISCNSCPKKFLTYELLESHMKTHEVEKPKLAKHECKKCSTIFKTGYMLRKHMRIHRRKKQVESKKEKFVCEVCGQVYPKTNMWMHMRIHTQYKQLQCPHCDYRATLQASLKTHIKLHTGERPYACEQCPYRCITSSNLNKHRKIHTGVKEYTCHICKKAYRHNASLRDHITSTHQGERKHKCKLCGAQYFHFKGLRKHMLVKHGQKVKKVKDDFVEIDSDSYTRMQKGKDSAECETGREETGMGSEETGMGSEDAEMGREAGISRKVAEMDCEDAEMSLEAGVNCDDAGMGRETARTGGEVEVGHEVPIVSYC